ncbi:MAG: hypothetical protein PHZ10_08200 [Aliarcobacter cryaerophilus]|nr:hypothetical protein [Aliarcobacter cryaerophilus]
MSDIIAEIEKIKYEIEQKNKQNTKIKELEAILNSEFITQEQSQIIQKRLIELKTEITNNQKRGIKRLQKYRLSSEKTSNISEQPLYIYDRLLECYKSTMLFGDGGVGKTLLLTGFANYGLENNTIKSAVFYDFDNGLVSLKKRKYDELADKWGIDKFDYLVGDEMLRDLEPIEALKELVLDGIENKDKMIVLDSGSHFVYDGTKNERQKLKELMDVAKILRSQGATPIIVHHSHRVRDGQEADYHGSFEWKRDLDYQILVTKNEATNTWVLSVKKDRDNLIESKAFTYNEDTVMIQEVNYEESNVSKKEALFIKEIQEILEDFEEEINQSELLNESRAFRQSIGLGDKRAIKWLEAWGEKGKWQRVQRPEKKNAIFYSSNRKTAKLPNSENMDNNHIEVSIEDKNQTAKLPNKEIVLKGKELLSDRQDRSLFQKNMNIDMPSIL